MNGKLYAIAGRDGSGALPYTEQFDPYAHPSTPPELIDYQVRINVAYDSDMKTDFSDLRFADSDGTTLISYWIQNYTASDSAIFWVKVPSIPTSSLKWIWMYYGNYKASSTSNGTNTFEFFDDFNVLDTGKWSTRGSPRVESGALVLDTTGSITSLSSFGSGYALETEAYVGSETSTNHWIGFCASDMTGPFTLFERGGGGSFAAYTYPNAQSTSISQSFLDSYHWYSITYVSGAEKYYIDDSLAATHSQTLGSMPVEFRVYSGTATIKSLWVAVRKYSSPEPVTIMGNEQTNETSLYVSPSATKKSSLEVGSSFKVNVTIENVIDLSGFDFNITWDSALLTFKNCYYNDTLDALWGSGKWFLAKNENGPGYCRLVALSTSGSFNTTQSQTLFTLELSVNGPTPPEETSIHFAIHKMSDSQAEPIAHLSQDGGYMYVEAPTLEMDPSVRVCRTIDEIFTLAVNVSDTDNVTGFAFEIHYNTTLLDYVNVSWNAWGSGTMNVNEAEGVIDGLTAGVAMSGTQTLMTVSLKAAYRHVWKSVAGWTNDLVDTIFFNGANLSYLVGPDLDYEKGGLNQININPGLAYTFSPIRGDVNNDGTVDVLDLRTVAIYYLVKQGDPNWAVASSYDLDGSGIIDVFDLRTAASNFGYTYVS